MLTNPPDPVPPRFLLDVHLGRLAAYLRLLGFDTEYDRQDPGDEHLAKRAAGEDRILLTCDRGLLMRAGVRHGRLLHSRNSRSQVVEVIERYQLRDHAEPFTRCMACNGLLEGATVELVRENAPPLVRRRYDLNLDYYRSCPQCDRLFWWGTHSDRMAKLLTEWRVSWTRRNVPPEN
jgi:uncharacterized protein with PIN domain